MEGVGWGVLSWVGCPADGPRQFVVVDDKIVGAFVVLHPGCFSCAWWADDEGDAGAGGAPLFGGFVVGSFVVAGGAGGSEVVGVVPGAAVVDWSDVVDLGGGCGAAGAVDLAELVVSFEDGAPDALPGAGVLGFGHEVDELSDSSRFLVALWCLPGCFCVSLLAVVALPAGVAEAGFVVASVGEFVAGGVYGAGASLAGVVGLFGALLSEVVESVGEVVELLDGSGGVGQ